MKSTLFALAVLVTLVVVSDVMFLHGLTAFIINAITSLF